MSAVSYFISIFCGVRFWLRIFALDAPSGIRDLWRETGLLQDRSGASKKQNGLNLAAQNPEYGHYVSKGVSFAGVRAGYDLPKMLSDRSAATGTRKRSPLCALTMRSIQRMKAPSHTRR